MMSQLPYLHLDGYMKLSNHLTFGLHKIVGGVLFKNHGVFFRVIQNSCLFTLILIRVMVTRYQLKGSKFMVLHGTIFLAKVSSLC
jgi:hypothetical protein